MYESSDLIQDEKKFEIQLGVRKQAAIVAYTHIRVRTHSGFECLARRAHSAIISRDSRPSFTNAVTFHTLIFLLSALRFNVVQNYKKIKTTQIMAACCLLNVINLLPNEDTWRFICRIVFLSNLVVFAHKHIQADRYMCARSFSPMFVYFNAWNGASANLIT